MKILIFLLLVCFPGFTEESFLNPQAEVNHSLSPIVPKELTSFISAPTVSIITGDYQEEGCDLVVEGIEPLFFRRFYNHLGSNSPEFGHWRIFPELTLFYNFDFNKNSMTTYKKFVIVGEESGSAFFCEQPHSKGFRLSPKEKGFIGETGQNHPLNLTIHFDRIASKERCTYNGTVHEGNGAIRSFITDWVPYKHDIAEPELPPYQARIVEYKRPNGNHLVYSYIEFNELFGRRKSLINPYYLVTRVTAYNRDKTKVLGWLQIDYRTGKCNNIESIDISGSDGRKVHLVQCLRKVQTANKNKDRKEAFDVVLQSVETPNKPQHSYQYHWEKASHYFDTCFLYQSVQNGVCLETLYDPKSKKVTSQNLPLGKNGEWIPIARYSYHNDHTQLLDGENQKTLFYFNEKNRLTSIEKYEGSTLFYKETNTWDPATGNLLKKKVGNLTISYLYDARHNPIEETITDGKESYTLYRTYSEDGFNLKLSETDGSGKITRYTYVPGTHLLASEIVYEHNVPKKRTFHTYDDCAILIKTIIDDGITLDPNHLSGVTYRKITLIQPKSTFPCFGLPEVVEEKTLDEGGNEVLLSKVIYSYHPSGQIAKEEHYDSRNTYRYSIDNQYNKQELLICTTNAEGYKTHFSYDERHNLIAVSGPHEDYYKEIHYDRVNRPIEEKVREKNGSFLLTKKRYNTLHQLISTTDESGFETHFAYNVLGQVKEIIHPDGGVEKKEYDPLGNLIQEIDPRGNVTHRTYNFRGSPTSILYPDGTSEHFTYNPNGTLKTHRDKQGAETRTSYDLFDHPLKEEVYSPEGTLLHTKSATWSAFNKLSETDEEGITTYFTYDYAGQKTSECKENLTIKYHYDSLGRLTQIQKPQTTHLKEFDHLNRLIEQRTEDKEGALTFKENYRYDAEGNQTHTITCLGETETLYNAQKLPIQITDPVGNTTKITYSYQGGFTKRTQDPDGILKIEEHGPLKRLKSYQVLNPKGETIQHRQFLYDLAGNRTCVIESLYEETTPTQLENLKN